MMPEALGERPGPPPPGADQCSAVLYSPPSNPDNVPPQTRENVPFGGVHGGGS